MRLSAAFLVVVGVLAAQQPENQTRNAPRGASRVTPIYRVSTIDRTIQAVNYRLGATKIDFRGTELLPWSHGSANVKNELGQIKADVEFQNLPPAGKFGAEYSTYVLWAIAPNGRAANLGEIPLNGTSGKLNVITKLRVFELALTAEPYYAVAQPSDLVVMENVVRTGTRAKGAGIDARFELPHRGQYAGEKLVALAAREALQTAEDSRAIAVKRQEADGLTAARTEASERKANAESARVAPESDRLKAALHRLGQEDAAQTAARQAELDSAASRKALLKAENAELRRQLLKQFNDVLPTRNTARGLIVNMPDVLFDTGRFSLRPLAREKLAKVAGILSRHPELRLDVEGYMDSAGGDNYNQRLSEQRGAAVRDYLMLQGLPVTSVTAKGLGETQPVASNDTAEGRQQNRRVELVISGEVIGAGIGTPIAAR